MRYGRLFWPILLIVVGVLFLLEQAGYLAAGEVIGRGWPLIIVAIGAVQLADNRRLMAGPIILIGAGLVLLTASTRVLPLDAAELLGPLILIAIGVFLLFGIGRHIGHEVANDQDHVDALAFFGANRQVSRSQHFHGGSLGAFFGGVDLDLRQARLAADAELDVTSAFGGVSVLVPRGWRVRIDGLPIFGGWANKTEEDKPLPEEAPTLLVRGVTIFGGLDVKHKE